jgi:hypothetical protein
LIPTWSLPQLGQTSMPIGISLPHWLHRVMSNFIVTTPFKADA